MQVGTLRASANEAEGGGGNQHGRTAAPPYSSDAGKTGNSSPASSGLAPAPRSRQVAILASVGTRAGPGLSAAATGAGRGWINPRSSMTSTAPLHNSPNPHYGEADRRGERQQHRQPPRPVPAG